MIFVLSPAHKCEMRGFLDYPLIVKYLRLCLKSATGYKKIIGNSFDITERVQTVWQCSSFRSFRLSAWILPKACPPTEGACLSRSIDPIDEWSSVGHTPCKTSAVGQTQSRAARTSQEQLVRRSASQWGPNGEQSLYLVICESRTPDFSGP